MAGKRRSNTRRLPAICPHRSLSPVSDICPVCFSHGFKHGVPDLDTNFTRPFPVGRPVDVLTQSSQTLINSMERSATKARKNCCRSYRAPRHHTKHVCTQLYEYRAERMKTLLSLVALITLAATLLNSV